MKTYLKRGCQVLFLLILCCLNINAQIKTVIYEGDTTTIFPNPERGWRQQVQPKCCDREPAISMGIILGPHYPLTVAGLQAWRNSDNAVTVFKDDVKIQQWTSDIPQSRLDEIQSDYDSIRKAGLKQIFRLVYNWGMTDGSPTEKIISRHLDQLAPIIRKNIDVIFAVEFGMFGGTGEAISSPEYIGRENNRMSSLKESALRLYNKFMSIVPADRMMPIHYAHYKYDMMLWENGNNYPSNAAPVAAENAFDGSKQSRIGYYNDNFAGDENHWGFFYAWPTEEKAFVAQDALYVLMEGELSGATDFNMQNGERELKKYHFTAYEPTGDGSAKVTAAWKNSGQWDRIARNLGYRFRLVKATLQTTLRPTSTFDLTINLANDGYARIMNPRLVEIILRNRSTGEKYVLNIDGDGKGNRLWLPGPEETKTLRVSGGIPESIKPGKYEVLLNLPDPYPSIHDRPEYSIRLANKDVWEAETGYNKLLCDVIIKKGKPVDLYKGNTVFKKVN